MLKYTSDSQGIIHERVHSDRSIQPERSHSPVEDFSKVAKAIADKHGQDGVGASSVRRGITAFSILPGAPKGSVPASLDMSLHRFRGALQHYPEGNGAPSIGRGLLPDALLRRLGAASSKAYYSLGRSASRCSTNALLLKALRSGPLGRAVSRLIRIVSIFNLGNVLYDALRGNSTTQASSRSLNQG
jgi:hypothetical protein